MKKILVLCSFMIMANAFAIGEMVAGPSLIVNPCTTSALVTENGFSGSPTPTSGTCGNTVTMPTISKTGVYDVAKAGTIASATSNDKNCALTGSTSSTACYDFSTAVPLPSGGGSAASGTTTSTSPSM